MACNTLTFPVDKSKVFMVKQWKLRVKKLFDVTVEFEYSRKHDKKTWISLGGKTASEDQCQKAKNYILSQVEPEISISIENVTLSKDFRDEIERESGTFVKELDGTVTIKGAEISVAVAKSLLLEENAVKSKTNNAFQEDKIGDMTYRQDGGSAAGTITADQPSVKSRSKVDKNQCSSIDRMRDISNPASSDDLPGRCISQLSLLEDVGRSAGFSMFEIEETLFQFDMNEEIKPSDFKTALRQYREVNQSLPNEESGGGSWSSLFATPHESLPKEAEGHSSSHHAANPHHPPPPPPPQFNSLSRKDGPGSEQAEVRRRAPPSETLASNTRKLDLRYIVIDGSNVAMKHGNGKVFSVRGIQIVIEYFLDRGHQVTAFVPQSRLYKTNPVPITDKKLLDILSKKGLLKFSPARRIDGKCMVCYDDRYILNLAESMQGVVVSNDQYRDLSREKPRYKEMIENRLLMFEFVNDLFMPPDDPLGRNGPTLEEFLQMPVTKKPASVRSRSQPQGEQPQSTGRSESVGRARTGQQGAAPQTQRSNAGTAGRSKEQTTSLLEELLRIFPEPCQKPIVQSVLQNHPTETDLSRLSNYCLNVIQN